MTRILPEKGSIMQYKISMWYAGDMRFLGIDYGTKRVGLSLSDENGEMAFPLAVIENSDSLVSQLEQVIEEKQVEQIVIGHSLNKDGGVNPVQSEVEELITNFTLSTGLPVHLEPEQYTTQAAIRDQGRNDMTDAAAATIILNSYIERNR